MVPHKQESPVAESGRRRKDFCERHSVEKWTVFNIKGNQYRLVTEIHYRFRRIYIRHGLSHAQYDQEKWKQ